MTGHEPLGKPRVGVEKDAAAEGGRRREGGVSHVVLLPRFWLLWEPHLSFLSVFSSCLRSSCLLPY